MTPPSWLDTAVFPFTLRTCGLPDGHLAYVDEGEGEPIVFVHGNPSWSFMYRAQIRGLRDRFRCLAVDHLGFGLSDKPSGASYHPRDHAERLGRWLDHVEADGIHLVVHDWGGPIGLGWALEHPERVKSLVILNTWMWQLDPDPEARRFSGVLSSAPLQFAIRRLGLFERTIMRMGFADRDKYTAVADQYRAPFTSAGERAGVADFPRQLMAASEWLGGLWERRERLADKPARLVWALKDPVFRKAALERWQELFPDAPVERVPGCGHYVAEEMGARLSPILAQHVDSLA